MIGSQYVLTAAHCIDDDLYMVRLGEHILDDKNYVMNRRNYTILKTYSHPLYNKKTLENDIAVVVLSVPVKYTSKNHI